MMMSPPYSSGDGLPATRREGKRMQVGEGFEQKIVHVCMLVYICYVCMYVCMLVFMYLCMEWLIYDPCNSVGVFAHLYMAGKSKQLR